MAHFAKKQRGDFPKKGGPDLRSSSLEKATVPEEYDLCVGWNQVILFFAMRYEIRIKKKVARGLTKLPDDVRKLFFLLVADLQADGPIQKSWRNFSPLGGDRYHCHLSYRYVACWTWRKNEIVIEVYYVGSREKAPY